LQKANGGLGQHYYDYGTNCNDCERYRKLGDICVIEHGKKFLWEYCRDFTPLVVLPDYKELMRSVRQEQALERKKLREKRLREKKKRLKEKLEREALRKKERRAKLRKLRAKEKTKRRRPAAQEAKNRSLRKALTDRSKSKRNPVAEGRTVPLSPEEKRIASTKPESKPADVLDLKDSQDGVVRKRYRVARKGPYVSNDKR
jgi:ATPase subunit of ABC transporter with duplicated ATPase domains